MKIYICGPFGKKNELREWRRYLEEKCGAEITSRWLNGSHDSDGDVTDPAEFARFANEDIEDIHHSDIVVAMIGQGGVSGGRHWECGYAQALGKLLILVGEPENVFHHQRFAVARYKTLEQAAQYINSPF